MQRQCSKGNSNPAHHSSPFSPRLYQILPYHADHTPTVYTSWPVALCLSRFPPPASPDRLTQVQSVFFYPSLPPPPAVFFLTYPSPIFHGLIDLLLLSLSRTLQSHWKHDSLITALSYQFTPPIPCSRYLVQFCYTHWKRTQASWTTLDRRP